MKDHVWQIIHFAWGIINQLKSGVFNEGQATHHSFLNEIFFSSSNHFLFNLFLHTGRHSTLLFFFFSFRGALSSNTFVRELLGNVLFKTEIFVQT